MPLTQALANGRLVWVDLVPPGYTPAPPLPPVLPAGPGLDYPPGLGPALGLVQGMTDGSETVRPLAQFNNPQGLVDDSTIIVDSLTRCGVTRLANASYQLHTPIVVPSGCALIGPFPILASQNDNYGAGTLVPPGGARLTAVPGSGFPNGSAVIDIFNATGVQQGGQVLANFYLEGNELPLGSGVSGIRLHGAVAAGQIIGVEVHRPDGPCFVSEADVGTGFVPDSWILQRCKGSASRSSYGAALTFLDDSWVSLCEMSENAQGGWYIDHGDNTRYVGCKGENNNLDANWRLRGLNAGQKQHFSACTSQLGKAGGWLWDNTSASATGTGSYVHTGCWSDQDGTNGTTVAAALNSGCLSRVAWTGGGITRQNATYQLAQQTAPYVTYATGAAITVTHDDGTGTHPLVNQVPVAF